MQGALKIKEKFPDTLLLFVVPPDADTLQKRLTGRGTETLDVIKKRLHRAVEETDYILKYDYLVVNDDIDESVEETHAIIQSEHFRVGRNEEFVKALQEDMKKFK